MNKDEALKQEPIGTLNISPLKGHLVKHDFDYFGELPDGTYSLYTALDSKYVVSCQA